MLCKLVRNLLLFIAIVSTTSQHYMTRSFRSHNCIFISQINLSALVKFELVDHRHVLYLSTAADVVEQIIRRLAFAPALYLVADAVVSHMVQLDGLTCCCVLSYGEASFQSGALLTNNESLDSIGYSVRRLLAVETVLQSARSVLASVDEVTIV